LRSAIDAVNPATPFNSIGVKKKEKKEKTCLFAKNALINSQKAEGCQNDDDF